ncbi:tetratricopeptide repeat protein, partial [Patescibacteria group bacterium]|nr:tetratricopeptide repeat protein [Patescibacteria group bacterium]
DKALDVYEKVLRIKPDYAKMHNNVANIYMQQKKPAEEEKKVKGKKKAKAKKKKAKATAKTTKTKPKTPKKDKEE